MCVRKEGGGSSPGSRLVEQSPLIFQLACRHGTDWSPLSTLPSWSPHSRAAAVMAGGTVQLLSVKKDTSPPPHVQLCACEGCGGGGGVGPLQPAAIAAQKSPHGSTPDVFHNKMFNRFIGLSKPMSVFVRSLSEQIQRPFSDDQQKTVRFSKPAVSKISLIKCVLRPLLTCVRQRTTAALPRVAMPTRFTTATAAAGDAAARQALLRLADVTLRAPDSGPRARRRDSTSTRSTLVYSRRRRRRRCRYCCC